MREDRVEGAEVSMVGKRGKCIGLYEFRMTSPIMLRTCPECSRRFHLESSLCMALHSVGVTPFHTRHERASLFTANHYRLGIFSAEQTCCHHRRPGNAAGFLLADSGHAFVSSSVR
jgi:hypothetical protein